MLDHGLLHTPGRTGAFHNWYPTFTSSPGVLQEITTDPITLCIQRALVNLCKSHNCSWIYNSWTRACGPGSAPASITQPPMSASHTCSMQTNSKHVRVCVCICACTHTQRQTQSQKCTWAKWLQMLILWVRKISNLNSGELPLGDTNVFWLLLCFFFFYRCCSHRKRLAAAGESTCPLLTALPIKRKCTTCLRLAVFLGWCRSNWQYLLISIFSSFSTFSTYVSDFSCVKTCQDFRSCLHIQHHHSHCKSKCQQHWKSPATVKFL